MGHNMNIDEMLGSRKNELIRICERHFVVRLEIFGSVAKGEADPESSDLDFLVEFKQLPPPETADAYFGLLEDLEGLFERQVDLVMITAAKNPYFLENIRPSRKVLYAA